jgi:hypothetical protein
MRVLFVGVCLAALPARALAQPAIFSATPETRLRGPLIQTPRFIRVSAEIES